MNSDPTEEVDMSVATEPVSAGKTKRQRHRAVPLSEEFRKFTVPSRLEVRSKAGTNELIVEGEPIQYDTQYSVRDIFGEFLEEIQRGASDEMLERGVDCRLLLNHEGIALARTASGTLTLTDSEKSLGFKATMDARMQAANDFSVAVERGDMDEMSVGMIVGRDEWGEENRGTAEEPDFIETRCITRLDDLLDVSGVTYAASPTTTIEVANRMAAALGVESRARLRRLEVALRNGEAKPEDMLEALVALRGGKVEGKPGDPARRAAAALESVLDAAGVDLPEEDEDEEPETEVEGGGAGDVPDEPAETEVAEEPRSSLHLAFALRQRRR